MSPKATWRRDLSTRLFLRVGIPFFYLLFFSSILLFVVLAPFVYLYGLLLCSMVWIDWSKKGKDLLVVYSSSEHSEEWMTRLSPLIQDRAVLLDYTTRKIWPRTSPEVLLFEIFGPRPTTEFFRQFYLPCVIVFPMFRRPQTFTFGTSSKDREERLEQLRAALAAQPQEIESIRD